MTEKYLQERLTESKLTSVQWRALAGCLEEFWRLHFADIEAFETDKNIFTASHTELDKKIRDFGDYFDVELPFDDSTKRLAIVWRRDSIHKKDTLSPFLLALKLNFQGLFVEWEQLYCKSFYASKNLLSASDAIRTGIDVNDCWLTSRGRLIVDVFHLNKINMSKKAFSTIIEREVKRLKPAHIVYDGIYFVLFIEFNYDALLFNVETKQSARFLTLDYSLTDKFDDKPSDTPYLDYSPFFVDRITSPIPQIQIYSFELKRMFWSLDQFIPLPNDKIPLQGKDGDVIEIVQSLKLRAPKEANFFLTTKFAQTNASHIHTSTPNFSFYLMHRFDEEASDSVPLDIVPFELEIIHSKGAFELKPIEATTLDQNWGFDSLPSDFIPLDFMTL